MGKGKSQTRRLKLQERANQGNLVKAALGKGGATAFLPLPSAPKKEDYTDRMPASLRKMLALKAVAEAPPAKRQKLQEQQQQHHHHHQPAGEQPAGEQQRDGQPPRGQGKGKQPKQPEAGAQATAAAAAAAAGATIWEQPKKLKARKKEYLKAKQLKKKHNKGARAAADAEQDEALPVDRPAFGEVVHAPPKVHLKSKHWDAAAAKQQEQQRQAQQAQKRQRQRQKQAKAPKAKQSQELQELREAAIEGYRAGRMPREGHATLDSLKALTAVK